MFLLFSMGIVTASTFETHGLPLSTSSSGGVDRGFMYCPTEDVNVTVIEKVGTSTAINCKIYDFYGGGAPTLLDSGSFSGNNCSVSQNLTANNCYVILSGNNFGNHETPYSSWAGTVATNFGKINGTCFLTGAAAFTCSNNLPTEIHSVLGLYANLITEPPATLSFLHPTSNGAVGLDYDGFINFTVNENATTCSLNNSDWNYDSDNNTYFQFLNNTIIGEGNYSINITCAFDAKDNVSGTLNFRVDTVRPAFVTSFVNETSFFNKNLTGMFNFSDDHLIFRVNFSIDGSTIFSLDNINNKTFNYTLNHNITALTPGDHTLTVFASDAHTRRRLGGDYGVDRGAIFHNKLRYNFYDGGYVRSYLKNGSLLDNWDSEKRIDRYSQILRPSNPRSQITIIEESDQRIKIIRSPNRYNGVWIIIGNHWKDYVIRDEPDATVSIRRITPFKVEVHIRNLQNPENIIFDSVGDLNTFKVDYLFTIIPVQEVFSSVIFNGVSTDYVLNFFNLSTTLPNVLININGTNFSAGLDSQTGNDSSFKYTDTFNFNITDSDIILHNWFFNLSEGDYDFTTIQNQTFINLTVNNCTGSGAYPILNFSYFDEVSGAAIQANNEYQLVFDDGVNQPSVNGQFLNSFDNSFCSNTDPAIVNFSWVVSGKILDLNAVNYATRLFDFTGGNSLLANNNPTVHQPLRLILLNQSTTVKYNWVTDAFQPVNGIMRVFSCNANGSNTLIEATPIIDAVAHANVQLLSVPYSYDVVIGDTIFKDLDGYSKCHIESAEEVSFIVEVTATEIAKKIGLQTLGCTVEQTGVDTVKVSWSENPEDDSPIEGCIFAYRMQIGGLVQVYENCTSTTNSIERAIPNSGFDYVVRGTLEQSGSKVVCDQEISFNFKNDAATLFSLNGLLGAVFLVMALGLFYAGNGEAQVIGSGLAIFLVWIFGIVMFDWLFISSVIAFLTIIVGIGRYTRK